MGGEGGMVVHVRDRYGWEGGEVGHICDSRCVDAIETLLSNFYLFNLISKSKSFANIHDFDELTSDIHKKYCGSFLYNFFITYNAIHSSKLKYK